MIRLLRTTPCYGCVETTIEAMDKYNITPPTSNIQFIKDSLYKEIDNELFKNALNKVADLKDYPTERNQPLLDYLNKPKSGNISLIRSITDFKRPELNDPNELIKGTFLM